MKKESILEAFDEKLMGFDLLIDDLGNSPEDLLKKDEYSILKTALFESKIDLKMIWEEVERKEDLELIK